jgi:toxin ParE1/3/4
MKLIWSPLAYQRLEDIFDFIANDNPEIAEKFTEGIIMKIELLIEYPNLGRVVPELKNQNYRELILGNYRVIYRLFQDSINILTIRHSKRLFDKDEVK